MSGYYRITYAPTERIDAPWITLERMHSAPLGALLLLQEDSYGTQYYRVVSVKAVRS